MKWRKDQRNVRLRIYCPSTWMHVRRKENGFFDLWRQLYWAKAKIFFFDIFRFSCSFCFVWMGSEAVNENNRFRVNLHSVWINLKHSPDGYDMNTSSSSSPVVGVGGVRWPSGELGGVSDRRRWCFRAERHHMGVKGGGLKIYNITGTLEIYHKQLSIYFRL